MSHDKIDLAKFDPARFKGEAKRLSKAEGIGHVKALDQLARPYGFANYQSLHKHWLTQRQPEISSAAPAEKDAELDALLAWFRSRYTRHGEYESRVSPRIARSLKHFERTGRRHQVPVVDVGDEIDFNYQRRAFQTNRHPRALAAEQILEVEGPWVANAFLDGLKIRHGGLFGDGADEIAGYRFTILALDEEDTEGSF